MNNLQLMNLMLEAAEQTRLESEARMDKIRNTRFSTTAPKNVILPFNTKLYK